MDRAFRSFVLIGTLLTLSACGSGDVVSSSFSNEDLADDRGQPEAFGFYTSGHLLGGTELPLSGFGHLKIFRGRERAWGTHTLVNTIVRAANNFRSQFPYGDRVQVGDLSQEGGGNISLHASHENGLDVDIAYLRSNFVERNPAGTGPNGFAEKFISRGKLSANFDTHRNWHILKQLVLQGTISRIFVDPKIKKTFCEQSGRIDPNAPASVKIEVLRRLRPYANHADHFHLRVKCPLYSSGCIEQDEPEEGSGCSSSSAATAAEHRV